MFITGFMRFRYKRFRDMLLLKVEIVVLEASAEEITATDKDGNSNLAACM